MATSNTTALNEYSIPNANKKEDVAAESITKEIITLGSVAVFYGGLATLGILAYKYDLRRAISRYF